jgi:prevent-host-death family protein
MRGCGRRPTIDQILYGLYAPVPLEGIMAKPLRRGAEEARNQLPELLNAAQRGRQTIITRHGRPVAVLAPISGGGEAYSQRSLLPLAGSGRGLYGRASRAPLNDLRGEWDR